MSRAQRGYRACVLAALLCAACGKRTEGNPEAVTTSQAAKVGTIEITAKLAEIPEGAIFKRDLYDYATVLKYDVLQVHRGELKARTIYVGQYNPWKPRSEAADQRVKGIGGDVRQFAAGDIHRMALEPSIDDHYMGGIINKYFGQDTGPIYWALWTDAAH